MLGDALRGNEKGGVRCHMFNSKLENPIVGRASAVIQSPPETVFQYIGVDFFTNYPKWSPEVVELNQLSDGAMGVGMLARQVRTDQGRRIESKFEVTAFEPHKQLVFSGVPDPFRCTYDLVPVEDGAATELTFIFEGFELRPHMRPFEKLIRRVVQDGAVRTTGNLKRLIEFQARRRKRSETGNRGRQGVAR
ncbi:MAG: SRPBCC family protein [Geminicoccaceae bacterium]